MAHKTKAKLVASAFKGKSSAESGVDKQLSEMSFSEVLRFVSDRTPEKRTELLKRFRELQSL